LEKLRRGKTKAAMMRRKIIVGAAVLVLIASILSTWFVFGTRRKVDANAIGVSYVRRDSAASGMPVGMPTPISLTNTSNRKLLVLLLAIQCKTATNDWTNVPQAHVVVIPPHEMKNTILDPPAPDGPWRLEMRVDEEIKGSERLTRAALYYAQNEWHRLRRGAGLRRRPSEFATNSAYWGHAAVVFSPVFE
jgi:hypothetical protein